MIKVFLISTLTIFLVGCKTNLLPGQILPPHPPPVSTDINAAEIKHFIDVLPRDAVTDAAIQVVKVTGNNRVGLYGVYRPKGLPGKSNLHQVSTTEIYYMLDGHGTLVTGGKIIDGVRAPATSITIKGSGIKDGVSRRMGPGDIVIIPGYTPHWWSELDDDLSYIIFRTGPDSKMELH